MMNAIELFLLAVALAMDCFTVSMMSGVMLRRPLGAAVWRMGLLFGLFQAAMPLAGWLLTAGFSRYIEAVDHWIAFGLLVFVGGRMVKESFGDAASPTLHPLRLRTQLLLAVATSIDALAVGISMACMGYSRLAQLARPLAVIGVVSLLLSLVGYQVGARCGAMVARRVKPELLGGLVLIGIGIKVLLQHLL